MHNERRLNLNIKNITKWSLCVLRKLNKDKGPHIELYLNYLATPICNYNSQTDLDTAGWVNGLMLQLGDEDQRLHH